MKEIPYNVGKLLDMFGLCSTDGKVYVHGPECLSTIKAVVPSQADMMADSFVGGASERM